MTVDQIKQAYLAGNLSAQEAVDLVKSQSVFFLLNKVARLEAELARFKEKEAA